MTNTRAWITWSLLVAGIGGMTASCGSDELTTKPPGGIVNSGGASGLGGGGGGGGLQGGGTAMGGSSSNARLGQACSTDTVCQSTGLTCNNDPSIANGICTSTCVSDSDCNAIAKGSLCVDSVCLEPCMIGSGQLTTKCHGRSDATCGAIKAQDTGNICADDTDCAGDTICSNGKCFQLLYGCAPTCRNDLDCTDGWFCDIGTGTCVEEKPTGKPVGSLCEADEECNGICLGNGDTGFCSGFCQATLEACGWSGEGPADAACLWVPFYNQAPGTGDLGYCGQLCDCNSDCRDPSDKCIAWREDANGVDDPDGAQLADLWQREGYCGSVAPNGTQKILDSCSGGGGGGGNEGGAGGAGAVSGGGAGGSAGSQDAGAGGASGGSTSEGGATSSPSAGAAGG